jgi:outer membrane lipoprotein-sorting protein
VLILTKKNINLNTILTFTICILCGSCMAQQSKQPESTPAAIAESPVTNQAKADPNRIDPASPLGQLLEKINTAAKTVQSCQAGVDYLFIQEPELLNSRTLRKGTLYYLKNDKGSKLRLNFDSVKQDEAEEEKKTEQYVFDGVWLTKIDYTTRQIDQYQQAPVDKPVEVFDYISHHFPIVGFSGTDVLEKQFFIQQVAATENEKKMLHLQLKVRPDSVYKDDYTQMDLWVSSERYLPVRMTSVSIQGDIYDISLLKMELNKPLADKIFEIKTPADFSKNVKTLQQKPEGKDSQWPKEL